MVSRRQIDFIRSWAWLFILCTVVSGAVAFAVASQLPRSYASQVSILIGPPLGGVITNEDIQAGQSLRQTYADLATTGPLLLKVIDATGVDMTPQELADSVVARAPSGSSLLFIEVTHADPAVASKLANGIAQELTEIPAGSSGLDPSPNVTLTVVDPAVRATLVNRGPTFYALMGAAIGFIFALGVAFVVDSLSRRRVGVEAES